MVKHALLSSQNTKHATFIVTHNNVDMYTQCYSEHCSKTSPERTMKGKRDKGQYECIKVCREYFVRLLYLVSLYKIGTCNQ